MGFIFKSAAGLGAVYFAMFAPALNSNDMAATASLCAAAAQSRLANEASLRAHWAAAGCVLAVSAQAQKGAVPPPRATPAAAPPRAKIAAGGLSDADLREPWFGPTGNPRKSAKRG
jgi:hypothetical protein